MIRICALVLAGFFTVSLSAFAQDKGPLAVLPSEPGPHIAKIKAMGDNEWLKLGAPAADPKWGKARGSAWGAKALILAPDKRGAFLFGEGVHAYVKPDGHSMDDLWFYDINAHAWMCVYPGMNTKTFNQRVKDKELKIDDNGLLTNSQRQPVPTLRSTNTMPVSTLSWRSTSRGRRQGSLFTTRRPIPGPIRFPFQQTAPSFNMLPTPATTRS